MLANTTSIGMHPDVAASPVAASALQQYELVFDAVYTPMATQLLKVSTTFKHVHIGEHVHTTMLKVSTAYGRESTLNRETCAH